MAKQAYLIVQIELIISCIIQSFFRYKNLKDSSGIYAQEILLTLLTL